MIGRRIPVVQRYAISVARQRFSTSLSPCRAILARHSLPVSSTLARTVNQISYIPLRAIHASGVRLGDVIVVEGPAFAESISEGDIRWIKQKGDFVNEDELVAEIETDKYQ
ncbi:hypothetical protein COOONC_12070 [Cooperia oncophora]